MKTWCVETTQVATPFFSPLSWLISSFFFWAVPSILLRSLCVFSFALWAAPSLSLSSRRHGTVTAFKIKDPLCLIHSAETTRWSHRRLVVSRAWFSVVCPYVRPSALRLSSVFLSVNHGNGSPLHRSSIVSVTGRRRWASFDPSTAFSQRLTVDLPRFGSSGRRGLAL